jgi:hypothetical protein
MSCTASCLRSVFRYARCRALALALSGLCLAGCAYNPNDPYGGWPGNFDRANLAPGISRYCYSDPCVAQYMMPDAGGAVHMVRVNNLPAGEFPASGQVVSLGAYYHYNSPYRFTIDGLDVPVSVLWVGGGYP